MAPRIFFQRGVRFPRAPSSQPIDHLVNVVTRLLDTRYSSFIATNDDTAQGEGRGGVEKGGRYTGIRHVIESTAHGRPCWYTIMRSNAPRHKGEEGVGVADLVGGGSLVETRAIRRLSYDNELAGRQGWSMTPWRTRVRGVLGAEIGLGTCLHRPTASSFSLAGIRNRVKLRVNGRYVNFLLCSSSLKYRIIYIYMWKVLNFVWEFEVILFFWLLIFPFSSFFWNFVNYEFLSVGYCCRMR